MSLYGDWRRLHPKTLPRRAGSIRIPICYDGNDKPLNWCTEYTYECGHHGRYTDLRNGVTCLICELMDEAVRKEDIAARGVGTYQI